jgi:hypothetical protein
MTVTQDGIATRDDVEAALWRWSGWKADQRSVDALMTVVDQWVGSIQPSDPGAAQAAAEILEQARREAAQIVQSAHDEAAVVQSPTQESEQSHPRNLKRFAAAIGAVRAYKDSKGAVWVRIGPAVEAELDGTRTCTGCQETKPISKFRLDSHGKGGRRSRCSDCDNAYNRERRAKKRQAAKEVGQ